MKTIFIFLFTQTKMNSVERVWNVMEQKNSNSLDFDRHVLAECSKGRRQLSITKFRGSWCGVDYNQIMQSAKLLWLIQIFTNWYNIHQEIQYSKKLLFVPGSNNSETESSERERVIKM